MTLDRYHSTVWMNGAIQNVVVLLAGILSIRGGVSLADDDDNPSVPILSIHKQISNSPSQFCPNHSSIFQAHSPNRRPQSPIQGSRPQHRGRGPVARHLLLHLLAGEGDPQPEHRPRHAHRASVGC